MRVARVEPERLLDELGYRRQPTISREVEIVGKPAIFDQKTNELLAKRGRLFSPEHRPPVYATIYGHRSMIGILWPFDGCDVAAVVIRPQRLDRVRDRRSAFATRPAACSRSLVQV